MDGLSPAPRHGAFLRHELELTVEALGPLLHAFKLDGAFGGPDSPEAMVTTDTREAKARYLRALYETTAVHERAAKLLREMDGLESVGGTVELRDLVEADVEPLPGPEGFLTL